MIPDIILRDCPLCKKEVIIFDTDAGVTIKCPNCGLTLFRPISIYNSALKEVVDTWNGGNENE